MKISSDILDLNIENVSLPCKVCQGYCCKNDIIFGYDDVKLLKKKYKKLFKKITIKEHPEMPALLLHKKGSNGKLDSCVFFKDNRCSIYEDRPNICKDYGVKKYIKCPFNNMSDDELLKLSATEKDALNKKSIISDREYIFNNIDKIDYEI